MDTDFAALLDSLSKTHTHICCYKITQGVWSNPVRRESADRCGGSSAKQTKRRTGLGGEEGERRGCRICWPRSTAKIILPTDKRGCERRETLKKKKRTSDTASAFTHVQVALLSYFKCQRSVAEHGGAFICVIHDQSSLRLSR